MSQEPQGAPASSEETASLPATRLAAGDIIAGRFAIVRFVARGGMGEVYEAEDRHLQGKRHALKTLRSDLARNETLRARFEREVLLAREVHHPYVCPTYDIFHVTDAKGPLSFLTMKLLNGESLHARIRREGRLTADTTKALAQQLASALDAAHARGVVHRDLKPGNVMLEEDSTGLHVSVTDFGLSRVHDAEETLGVPGQVLGTPGYVAPEILRGQTAGFGVDVYAFGVIVYEMLTGRRPDDALFPTPATRLVPGLNDYWDRVIEGCLAAQPQFRYKSCGDALTLATRDLPPAADITTSSSRGLIAKTAAVAVLALAIVGGSWLAFSNWERFLRPLPEKRYVALMAWPADADASHQPLLRTVLDTVGSRLSRAESSTPGLTIINPADVGGTSIVKTPADAATALGANLILASAIDTRDAAVHLRLAVLDASTGRVLRERADTLASAQLARLGNAASALAAAMLDLDLPAGTLRDRDEQAALPPDAFALLAAADELAARPNSAGLDDAIAGYQKLVESQPRFALGHARLAAAYVRKHTSAPDRAVLTLAERNADLALRYNTDSVAATVSRASVDLALGRSEPALSGLQRALDLDPGNPEVLMVRAQALRSLDRLREEESVYREILHSRPNYWPAYENLGLCLYRQARYQEAAQVYKEGLVVAPAIVRLLNNLGAMQLLMQQHDEARRTFERSVQASPSSAALQNLGTLAFRDGAYAKALEFYLRAQTLTPRNELLLRNLGDTHTVLGDYAKARSSYEAGQRVVQERLDINANNGSNWMLLAYYQSKLGRLDEAKRSLSRAEALGATDVPSQLRKVQILVRVGERDAALALLLDLRQRGLSHEDVELALDLKDLRSDSRYIASLSKTRP